MDVSGRKVLSVRKWGWGGRGEGGLSTCAMDAPEKRRMGRMRALRKGDSVRRSLLGWPAADAPPALSSVSTSMR